MLKVQIIGNLGSEPEVKNTKSGRQYLSFSVAHDRGQNVPTVWARICWFDGVNHRLQPYIRKGAKLCITGDASVEAFIDRNGQPACSITVYPDSVEMVLFPKREEGTAPADGRYQPQPAAQPAAPSNAGQGTRHWTGRGLPPSDDSAPSYQRRTAPTGPIPPPEPPYGPGNPEYDELPAFLKDEDMPL